jgi:hypothetical protein
METVGMPGVPFQDPPINSFSLRRPSGLMMSQSIRQQAPNDSRPNHYFTLIDAELLAWFPTVMVSG